MNKSMFKFINKLVACVLCTIALVELALALWTVLENRYRVLAYNLADVGYIDLWVLRYLSICLFASSIITLLMCLILIWGLYSAHVFIFISSTMMTFIILAELIISITALEKKFQTRITLQEQLPKLVITYRQGNDERSSRALDTLQEKFQCCGSDGRLSFQNNVPLSCNMFNVGCLTRTLYFLDASMDLLGYLLLCSSLIKLFIVLYFYSFLCLYQRDRLKHTDKRRNSMNDSTQWRHSSSFDSSSTENIPKKILLSSSSIPSQNLHHENTYVEKRHVVLNDYDSQSDNKRVQTAAPILIPPVIETSSNSPSTSSYDRHAARKLSSISERTEKTETDESEPDLLRIKQYNQKRKTSVNAVNQNKAPPRPPPLPKKLPIIKNQKNIDHNDDHDSGVERSPSEKSFDEQNSSKRHSNTSVSIDSTNKSKLSIGKTIAKSTPTLSFSNVFITSTSQGQIINQSQINELKKPITISPSSSSSSSSDHLLLNDATRRKPILKKSSTNDLSQSNDKDHIPPSYREQKKMSSILNSKSYIKLTEPNLKPNTLPKPYVPYSITDHTQLKNAPKPAPRPSLKQPSINKQGESLV